MKMYDGNLMSLLNHFQSKGMIDGTEYLQESHEGPEAASGNNVVFTTSSFTLTSI